MTAPNLLSASSINGDGVRNAQGEDLGSIKDLMVNTDSGEIEYAVVSFGGLFGIGDKYFAIPFNQFSVDRENECMVLNVEKDRLENAPGFDKDNWPNFADDTFRQTIYTHYRVAA